MTDAEMEKKGKKSKVKREEVLEDMKQLAGTED